MLASVSGTRYEVADPDVMIDRLHEGTKLRLFHELRYCPGTCIAECWARNEAGGTLAVTEFHNLLGLDRHL